QDFPAVYTTSARVPTARWRQIPVLDFNTDRPSRPHPAEYHVDKNPTINVLVLAELLPQGEQLVRALRRPGIRLHAEAVRDERWLRERLLSHRWELLCILANRRIPAQRVGAVLREMQPDLLCVTIGSAAAEAATATGYPSVPAEFPHLLDLPDV